MANCLHTLNNKGPTALPCGIPSFMVLPLEKLSTPFNLTDNSETISKQLDPYLIETIYPAVAMLWSRESKALYESLSTTLIEKSHLY